jgi:hypothetical protein
MDADDLIRALRTEVFEPAVSGTIRGMISPPGRSPHATMVKASDWYHGLTDRDAAYVAWVARDAAYTAIFGVLCVLDGVRVIDDEHGDLVLTYEREGTAPLRLNVPATEELHSLWTSEASPYLEDLPA